MSLIDSIKARLGFDTRQDTLEFMPSERRENSIPKFKLLKDVNAQGQIYIPVDKRETSGSNVEVGDKLSLDIFAANYGEGNGVGYDKREKYVDVNVISNHRITIPAEVRDELDIQEGDTIAVHAHHRME